MRVAIISDIHANMTALEAVLDDVQTQSVERTYCLGDLVGYAAHPNEVIDRISRNETPTIMGNYDDGVGFDRDECGCCSRTGRSRAFNAWPRRARRTCRSSAIPISRT